MAINLAVYNDCKRGLNHHNILHKSKYVGGVELEGYVLYPYAGIILCAECEEVITECELWHVSHKIFTSFMEKSELNYVPYNVKEHFDMNHGIIHIPICNYYLGWGAYTSVEGRSKYKPGAWVNWIKKQLDVNNKLPLYDKDTGEDRIVSKVIDNIGILEEGTPINLEDLVKWKP